MPKDVDLLNAERFRWTYSNRAALCTRWRCGWTTGKNWSHWRWHNRPKNMACSSNLSSRVKQHRMLLSNGSTGHTGQKFWIFACSEHWMKHRKLPSAGWWHITTSGLISPWTTWRRKSTDWWPNTRKSQKVCGTKTSVLTVTRKRVNSVIDNYAWCNLLILMVL